MQTRKRTRDQMETLNNHIETTNRLLTALVTQNKKICELLSSMVQTLDSVDESALEIQHHLMEKNAAVPTAASVLADPAAENSRSAVDDSNLQPHQPYPQEKLDAFVA